MNLADCYRLLGLRVGASQADLKKAYRQLARRYHPDANPGNQEASDKFIQVTEAYKTLMGAAIVSDGSAKANWPSSPGSSTSKAESRRSTVTGDRPASSGTRVRAKPRFPKVEYLPDLSESEQLLKQRSYLQLQDFLKTRRFPRAIALVEGLAQRLPQDPEVRQWQAIAYQRWGRHLIRTKDYDKARVYLKKALRTDPHNRSLWSEVDRDFRRLEQVY